MEAWKKICSQRAWSFLRAETQFLISASRSGTATVVRGNSTVTGVSLVFVATDVGRQIRFGTDFPQTILAVDLVLNTATLDRAYSGASGAAVTGTILDCYVTCPTDFGSFISVVDHSSGIHLRLWVSQEELNKWDPQRTYSGLEPLVLAALGESSTGLLRYELWPYPTSEKALLVRYLRSAVEILDTDVLPGVFAERSDILVTGALAEAASWPGSVEQKNPYFNLMLAAAKRAEFQAEILKLTLRDEDRFLTWLPEMRAGGPAVPELASYERNHE